MRAPPQTGAARRWAILSLALGMLQMAGAAFSFAMLIETGAYTLLLTAVASTALLTTVSVLLFGTRIGFSKAQPGGNDRHEQA